MVSSCLTPEGLSQGSESRGTVTAPYLNCSKGTPFAGKPAVIKSPIKSEGKPRVPGAAEAQSADKDLERRRRDHPEGGRGSIFHFAHLILAPFKNGENKANMFPEKRAIRCQRNIYFGRSEPTQQESHCGPRTILPPVLSAWMCAPISNTDPVGITQDCSCRCRRAFTCRWNSGTIQIKHRIDVHGPNPSWSPQDASHMHADHRLMRATPSSLSPRYGEDLAYSYQIAPPPPIPIRCS